MVIALIGESCTGKSTLAGMLKEKLGASVFSGKDYLRLAKGEADARQAFCTLLAAHMKRDAEPFIYVISEKEHLAFLPAGALRILVTAELSVIQERFARRTGGKLPPPLAAMLEKKHGMFDAEPHDLLVKNGEMSTDAACAAIMERIA